MLCSLQLWSIVDEDVLVCSVGSKNKSRPRVSRYNIKGLADIIMYQHLQHPLPSEIRRISKMKYLVTQRDENDKS